MAAGLEVAAGAAQVISLAFQVFQGCIEAYKFCHTAQIIGPEGDLLRTKLQIERYRLEEWAHCSRLDTASPDARLHWQVIYGILEQQHTILTSAEQLQRKYGLNLPEIKFSEKEEKKRAKQEEEERPSGGLDRVLRLLRPKLYVNSSSAAIAAANGPLKRLQWAAAGRDRVVKVIDDLSELNTHLERLLDLHDRTWLKSGLSALLRDTLSHTTDLTDVETLQALLRPTSGVGDAAIASAARFKRIRLVLGVDQRPDEIRPPRPQYDSMPSLTMLKEKRLKATSGDLNKGMGLDLARYNDEKVLAEWRVTSALKYEVLKTQMQALALLLGNTDGTFATLHCKGLVAAKESCKFALIYAMPATIDASEVEHRDLRALMSGQKRVSLAHRVEIASNLAEAVLQLHTAGWLHKSIRSENVIFLASRKSSAEAFLAGKPYLMGYDYARPESETSLTELPDAPLHTDLYRHPDKRGPVASGYKKRFDLYALGCVLVELALWEPLVDILSRLTETDWATSIVDAERAKKDLKLPSLLDVVQSDAFADDMSHAVGPRYLEAINSCLKGTTTANDNRIDEASLTIQRNVVEKLRECKV